MNRRPPSLRRVALLLTLPVLLLAAAGVWVIVAEHRQAGMVLQKQALEVLDAVKEEILHPAVSESIAGLTVTLSAWQQPGGEPPSPSPLYAAFQKAIQAHREGRKDEVLRRLSELRQSVELQQSVTEAGLPLRPLVEHLWLDTGISREVAAHALCYAAVRQPSLLTTRLVEDALPFLAEAAQARWKSRAWSAEELIRAIKERRHPAGWELASEADGTLVCIPVAEVATAVEHTREHRFAFIPAAFGVGVEWRSHSILNASGEILASGSSGAWTFMITLAHPEVALAETARRTRRVAWLLCAVLLVVAAAMWMTFRAFKKQAELSRLQSEFVASVSHELRTPVASIGALAERLESGKAGAEQTAEYHRFIAREGRRLAALVDNVLDFSRIERGSKAYDFDHADLPRLIRETTALLRPAAEEKGLIVTDEIQDVPESHWPSVDAVALRQALVNLLDNAIKFTLAGGAVTVTFAMETAGSDGSVRSVILSVSDTGIGIPAGEQGKIFERFYRVDNGLRRETTGAGIGLSLVKHIVEAHGAKVTVASEPGHGSDFTLHFPPQPNHKS